MTETDYYPHKQAQA
jgi:hypothetical protein